MNEDCLGKGPAGRAAMSKLFALSICKICCLSTLNAGWNDYSNILIVPIVPCFAMTSKRLHENSWLLLDWHHDWRVTVCCFSNFVISALSAHSLDGHCCHIIHLLSCSFFWTPLLPGSCHCYCCLTQKRNMLHASMQISQTAIDCCIVTSLAHCHCLEKTDYWSTCLTQLLLPWS